MDEEYHNGASSVESDRLLFGRNSYNSIASTSTAISIAANENSEKRSCSCSSDVDIGTVADINYGGDGNEKNITRTTTTTTVAAATTASSIFQVSINMTKMCIGTGVLALPYATSEAGLLWYVVGLSIVTAWNIYSTDRLLKCHHHMNEFEKRNCRKDITVRSESEEENLIISPSSLPSLSEAEAAAAASLKRQSYRSTSDERTINFDEHFEVDFQNCGENTDDENYDNNKNTGTFGKVALFAFGSSGLHLVDTSMMILMFGIIIAYEDAILGFVDNTPLASGNKNVDALFMLLIITPLASLSDFSVISKVSALGTSIILLVFIMIGWYGVHENGYTGFTLLDDQPLFPNGFSGFSAWYGCVAFGFGTVPFTFNLKESMENPNQMMRATKISLWLVCLIYILMGGLVSIIFWPSSHGIQSDVISVLPANGLLSDFIKLSMTIVILFTTPLIIVPCGDLVKRKLGFNSDEHGQCGKTGIETIIRISVCILCGFISVLVPNFVYVISFFGCLCVSLIGYCFPPLAHILCLLKLRSKRLISPSELRQMFIDGLLLPIGFISCVFTSYLTFQTMMEKMKK